ncbi:MAG: hypothetical protein HC875_10065 [Anaerolineales bacterium]|nr:hypothetical protein [Anaerolineales bacterium]
MKQLKNLATTFCLALALVIVVIAGLLGLTVEPTQADGLIRPRSLCSLPTTK